MNPALSSPARSPRAPAFLAHIAARFVLLAVLLAGAFSAPQGFATAAAKAPLGASVSSQWRGGALRSADLGTVLVERRVAKKPGWKGPGDALPGERATPHAHDGPSESAPAWAARLLGSPLFPAYHARAPPSLA